MIVDLYKHFYDVVEVMCMSYVIYYLHQVRSDWPAVISLAPNGSTCSLNFSRLFPAERISPKVASSYESYALFMSPPIPLTQHFLLV